MRRLPALLALADVRQAHSALHPDLVHTTLTLDPAPRFVCRFSMVDDTAGELFPLVYQFLIQQVRTLSSRELI